MFFKVNFERQSPRDLWLKQISQFWLQITLVTEILVILMFKCRIFVLK